MNALLTERRTPLILRADRAAELMTPNPVSISEMATVRKALELLTEKGFSAAPVLDEAGRPVGVLSRTDLLVHRREVVACGRGAPERQEVPEGYQIEEVDITTVRDVMTPVVFSVALDTPAVSVVNQLLGLKVHRLFVV